MSHSDITWKPIVRPADIRPENGIAVWHREGFPVLAYSTGRDHDNPGQLVRRYAETPLDWSDFTHFIYMGEPKGFVRKPAKPVAAISRESRITMLP